MPRGPKECPGMKINDPKGDGKLKCVPTNGIPYQGGFYLIQVIFDFIYGRFVGLDFTEIIKNVFLI